VPWSPETEAGSPLERALARWELLVLDGALATELERHGADLSGGLWSARLLLDQPDLIAGVHRDYFEAGADVAITASYQASVAGFVRAGLNSRQARQLISSSVEVAVKTRDDFWDEALGNDPRVAERRPRPLVATSVGPYGAVLADGSEYRGDYQVSRSDLVRFHRERLEVLLAPGVEVLACETIPSLVEAEALVEAMSGWPEVTAWVSFSARNGREVSDGTAISACARFLHGASQVVAVGVNCTALPHITSLVRQVAAHTDKPVVVYPNSGEAYDASRHRWVGSRAPGDFGRLAAEWRAAGARLVGGCCRTGQDEVRAVSHLRQ
jgi:homocysteine S-methyltransferase